MLHSMTGFGRSVIEEAEGTQTWEIRSVNNRFLDLKWRLPHHLRAFEAGFERLVRKVASRGRVDISLTLHKIDPQDSLHFQKTQAVAMLDAVTTLAASRGHTYIPDYNALLSISSLWQSEKENLVDDMEERLVSGLTMALEDWNESRMIEGKALGVDLMSRIIKLEEWVLLLEEQAPSIKEERIQTLRERLLDVFSVSGLELDDARFLQETLILTDKLDVTEELTRLSAHLERLRDLLEAGKDAGRRLDFTLQECFREISTCGNKIQDAQISRLVVDFKNELEKCREQVQNME